jgi:hypothetical protein
MTNDIKKTLGEYTEQVENKAKGGALPSEYK